MTAREAVSDFFTSHVSIALNIAFLAHQTLVAIDAVVRTVIRSVITRTAGCSNGKPLPKPSWVSGSELR